MEENNENKEAAGTSPAGGNSKEQPAGIDPKSVLLPNKDIHSLDSAQRVNAGELYQEEQAAELPRVPKPEPLIPERHDESLVVPLETYQSDIQKYIREKNVTAVTVAAAEADRSARIIHEAPKAPEDERQKERSSHTLELAALLGGLLIVVCAIGVFSYAYFSSRSLPSKLAAQAPFIAVDGVADISLNLTDTHNIIMKTLLDAKSKVQLPFSLIGQVPRPCDLKWRTAAVCADLMSAFAPNMPPALLRTLGPQFLLAIHSYDQNQPLLMFTVDSYENGYAGMLAWEAHMQDDLLPLFQYTPSPHPNITPVGTVVPRPQILQTGFVDTIVENHDARAIINSYGEISLVWLFVDRSTVIITTNPNTVHEVIGPA
jgi:hypothetical protein